mmetsp:Transcript_6944/g.18010  ORF Transcript_6944/g.18010 Transcript_6944/m.18010 type:complete len:108 (-) Transcript_6944:755-1078(-)
MSMLTLVPLVGTSPETSVTPAIYPPRTSTGLSQMDSTSPARRGMAGKRRCSNAACAIGDWHTSYLMGRAGCRLLDLLDLRQPRVNRLASLDAISVAWPITPPPVLAQ